MKIKGSIGRRRIGLSGLVAFVALFAAPLVQAQATPGQNPVRAESVHEYIARTRGWSHGQYTSNRSPDRGELQVFRIELVGERPRFIEGGARFEVHFDPQSARVVGERHLD